MENFSTLPQLISYQASKFNNPSALNFFQNEEKKSFSNQKFKENIFYFACGLKEISFRKHQKFAIYSYQNPIWLIADLGAILAGAVTVPIFYNIAKENLFYQMKDAEVSYIFIDSIEYFEAIKNENLDIKIITYGFRKENETCFEDLILLGKKASENKKYNFDDFVKTAKPDDLATIIYTSGSTGKPKGVELTSRSLISQIHASAKCFPLDAKRDVALSFLPLAHIFERMVMMFYISQGITIYFAQDVKNLPKLLHEIHPSLITSVPRLMEKIFAKIKENIDAAKGVKKILAKAAFARALSRSEESKKTVADKIYDILVYGKLRQIFGAKLRMIICGGSALSEDLERFYSNIGIKIFCGYGLTETSPVIAANCESVSKFGTVGKAFDGVELKLASDGELLVKGDNVMRGYHNDPEKTQQTIVDGWLKTGDLADIDKDGFVKIIGRKKELFKTANGKYVAPIFIEQKLVQELGFLVGAIVIAEGRKFVSSVIFPDFEILEKFKKKFSAQNLSDADFLRSKILYDFVQKKINKINENLDHWQQIQKFYIAMQPISIESGEITPSMKLKRNVLEEKYKNVVEKFYE